MSKHTPGPWYLCGDFTHKIVDVDESYYWTRVYSESDADIAPARAYGVTKEEAESNASLIAAAPDLLHYLKVAVEIIKNEYPEGQWADYSVPGMEETIKRAEGEQL